MTVLQVYDGEIGALAFLQMESCWSPAIGRTT
jgi:hypothetical protein